MDEPAPIASSGAPASLPPASSKGGIHLGYLDGLRGAAALYVVFHHFTLLGAGDLPKWVDALFAWTRFGHFAVDVFITLSGFCLMLPVVRSHGHELKGGLAQFFLRRARRILPPYWAALAFAITLAWLQRSYRGMAPLTAGDIAAHVFLLQNINPAWLYQLDMAMWSIATEWQIYFVFALVLLPLWRMRGDVAAVAAGFTLGLIPHFTLRSGHNLDCACPWYIGLFALGMAGANLAFSTGARRAREWPPKWYLLVAALLLIPYVGLKLAPGQPAGDEMSSLEWLKDTAGGGIALSLILYCALSAKQTPATELPWMVRVLESRPMVLLGTFSYSIYLVHCLILEVLQTAETALRLSPMRAFELRTLIGIPVAVALSYLFFLVFERPFLVTRRNETPAEVARDVALSPAP